MALPLYLAMTAAEMNACSPFPAHMAWMACHFSPWSQGLTGIPEQLPPGAMLIFNDRFPCQGHSPALVAQQLANVLSRLECETLLLDFQRPPEAHSSSVVETVVETLPRPPAVSEAYARPFHCPVFLPPAPLHLPLQEHLAPWEGREIWLEAALCHETVTITREGATFAPQFPPAPPDGGFFDHSLCCHYQVHTSETQITFDLFDTPQSLERKLQKAHDLGVTRAVGLYQELGR